MTRLLSMLALLSLSAAAQNIPMFRGGLDHSGVYTGKAPHSAPKTKWRFSTGGAVISSPAVVNGVVYIGSMDQKFYALDKETGKPKWTFQAESSIASSPAVEGGTVYFGSFDGNFYALDAATGQLKWKFATAGERRFTHPGLHGLQPSGEFMPDPWDFFLSSPALAGGKVFFGSGDGHVYALDAATGSLKWKFRTGNVVHSSPAIMGGAVFVGSWDGSFYALEADSGKLRWRFQAGVDPQTGNQQGFQSSPAVSGGVVFVGCRDSNVYALDAKTGEKKWAVSNKGSWIMPTPAVHQAMVYFGTSDTGLLRAVDERTGADVFTMDARFPVYASPSVADGALYVGTFGGKLLSLDLKTRKVEWEFQTEASKRNLPGVSTSEGKIDFSGMMRYNFYDEMVLGVAKYLATGSILSSPVIAESVIYFGSADGNVYALM